MLHNSRTLAFVFLKVMTVRLNIFTARAYHQQLTIHYYDNMVQTGTEVDELWTSCYLEAVCHWGFSTTRCTESYPGSFPLFKMKKSTMCYRFHKDETTFLGLTPSSPAVSDCAIILMIRLNRLLQCSFKCIQGGLNVLCAWPGSCCQSAAVGYSCGKKSFHPGCWKSKRKQKIKREVWLNYARNSS